MKKKFLVSMEVTVEMDDNNLSAILEPFNEFIFDTDETGLLEHIASQTARGFDSVELVGDNGKDYVATIGYTEIEEVDM